MRLGRKIREIIVTPARPPIPEPVRLPERTEPVQPQQQPESPERAPTPTPAR